MTKYVRFVERHRKLTFDHPVPVKFLGDKAFVKAYQGDNPKVSKRDRAEAERYAGQLRALGLIAGPVDLIQSERDLDAADVVGFYDQQKHALFVRGEDLGNTDVRVTLVHELTHALQDQKFDLDALDRQAETSGESFAETALVEGDADQRGERVRRVPAPARTGRVRRVVRRPVPATRRAVDRARAAGAGAVRVGAVRLRSAVPRHAEGRGRAGPGRRRVPRSAPVRGGDHRRGGGEARRSSAGGRGAEARAGASGATVRPTTSAP